MQAQMYPTAATICEGVGYTPWWTYKNQKKNFKILTKFNNKIKEQNKQKF